MPDRCPAVQVLSFHAYDGTPISLCPLRLAFQATDNGKLGHWEARALSVPCLSEQSRGNARRAVVPQPSLP